MGGTGVLVRLDDFKMASGVFRQGELLRAVSLREGQGMVEASGELLRSPGARTGPAGRYVVSAAMLGAIASGDAAAAGRIWSDFAPGLFGAEKPELLFQVLQAESRRGASGGRRDPSGARQ